MHGAKMGHILLTHVGLNLMEVAQVGHILLIHVHFSLDECGPGGLQICRPMAVRTFMNKMAMWPAQGDW